jgi:hypothetical protein
MRYLIGHVPQQSTFIHLRTLKKVIKADTARHVDMSAALEKNGHHGLKDGAYGISDLNELLTSSGTRNSSLTPKI